MTEGMGQAIDPSGEARSVLQSAVADYGTPVLSNAAILDGICEDRLPEWPREASLVSIAARADVAAMLQQQAGGVGADAAVRMTAASLADSRSIDPSAALWVVSEFARALGYQVSESLRPAGGAAAAAAAAGAGAAGAAGAAMPPVTSPGSPPGEDLTVPPGALGHPPTQQAGFGNRETVTTGQGGQQPALAPAGMPPPPGQAGLAGLAGPAVAGQPALAPAGMPPPPGGQAGSPAGGQAGMPQYGGQAGMAPTPTGGQAGMPPPPTGGQAAGGYGWTPGGATTAQGGPGWPGPGGTQPGPPGAPAGGGRPPRQGLVLGIGAAVLVVAYLIIAGVAHLPPFGKAAAPHPSASGSASASAPSSPTPAASATTFQPTSGDLTLESLIPADVSANGSCSPVHTPAFGSIAEMHCAGAPNIPAAYVQYYLFANNAAMNDAYNTYLRDFAQRSKNTGRCHRINGTAAFNSFSPCETQFSLGSTAEGRIAEYFYKGSPDISSIFTPHKVLVDMQGNDGNALIRWWDHSRNWINS